MNYETFEQEFVFFCLIWPTGKAQPYRFFAVNWINSFESFLGFFLYLSAILWVGHAGQKVATVS